MAICTVQQVREKGEFLVQHIIGKTNVVGSEVTQVGWENIY